MNLISHLGSTAGLRIAAMGILAPAVACLLAVILCRLNGRASAAFRHLVWMLTFVMMAVGVPIVLFHLQVRMPILPPPPAESTPAIGFRTISRSFAEIGMRPMAIATPLRDSPLAALGSPAAPTPRQTASWLHALPWTGLLAGLWGAGFLVLWCRFLTGTLRLHRTIQQSRDAEDPLLISLWTELSSSTSIRPPRRLLVSSEVRIPLVTGLLRSVVIVPDAASHWPAPMLRAALVHELAHLQRHDLLSSAFARIVTSFYWFNPLAWYGLRSLHAEAEMAADDCVVVAEAQPVAYAESLVLLVRSLRGQEGSLFPAIGMLRGRGIEARLERILDPRHQRLAPRGMIRWSALSGVALVTAGVLMVRPVAALPPSADTIAGADEQKAAAPSIVLPPQEILIQAVAENDLPKAQAALKAGADPNGESDYVHAGGYYAHSTPLYFAAEQGYLPCVRFLVEHGASVKPGKSTWTNAINASLRNGFGDVAKYLHEAGATCDPLAYAAATGDLNAIKQLAITAEPKSLAEAAITAAGCGQIAALRELLGDKGDPTKAFHRAASDGAIESMQFLLDRGLNLQAAGGDALLKAAYKGQTRAVAFLLKAGVKPNPEKQIEETALHRAASVGAVESVKLLLAAGADPNSLTDEENDKGSTPLFSVCRSDNEKIARMLLDRGARLDIVNQGGFTPVLYAAYSHAPRCLALFMDRGADIKAVNPHWRSGLLKFAMIFTGEDADRPDMKVTMAGVSRDMETVKVLLDKGVDVNSADDEGFTMLSCAISNGQTACMEMLLQRGARTNTVDRYGATHLIRVILSPVKEEWRLAVIDRLFAHGLDPNIGFDNPNDSEYPAPSALKAVMCGGLNMREPEDPVHTVVQERHKLLGILLAHGARFPVEKNSDAEKMLLAASTGDLAAVEGLLAKGVSPNVADAKGWTPLLSASALADSAILTALVNAGADVKARDAMGLTALQFAARRYPDLTDFHLLLDKGADVNGEGKGMFSGPVLFTAIGQSDPALTLELLKRGANPNRSPTSMVNLLDPIERAVDLLMRQPNDQKRREIVKLLLQFGADPNLKRKNSRSLLFFPVANDMVDLTKFLLGSGINPRKDQDGGKAVSEQAERHGSQEMKSLIKAALEKNAKP